MMKKISLSACCLLSSMLVIAPMPVIAQGELEARLQDGRKVILKEDGTYSLSDNERAIIIRLRDLGAPSGFMSDARRDCGVVFEVENNLGGHLLGFNAELIVLDKTGAEVLNEGILKYDIDMFAFEDADIPNGRKKVHTVDVQLSCSDIQSISISNVREKYCNYEGRQAGDTCRSLIAVENRVSSVDFNL